MVKGVEGTIVTRFDYQNLLITVGIVFCGLVLLVWIGAIGTLVEKLRSSRSTARDADE